VTDIFSKVTLDVIGVVVLGVELGNISSQNSPSNSKWNFHECYDTLFFQSNLGQILTFANAFIPLRWLPLQVNLKFKQARDAVVKMLDEFLDRRMKEVKTAGKSSTKGIGDGRDLLTFMLEETLAEDGQNCWTHAQLRDSVSKPLMLRHASNNNPSQLLQFISAGHDTTAVALCHASYTLACMPEVQERLRKEVIDAFQAKTELDVADVEGMNYMNNFIREVLRLYSPSKPPLPFTRHFNLITIWI
jgi:cytochrome P450